MDFTTHSFPGSSHYKFFLPTITGKLSLQKIHGCSVVAWPLAVLGHPWLACIAPHSTVDLSTEEPPKMHANAGSTANLQDGAVEIKLVGVVSRGIGSARGHQPAVDSQLSAKFFGRSVRRRRAGNTILQLLLVWTRCRQQNETVRTNLEQWIEFRLCVQGGHASYD